MPIEKDDFYTPSWYEPNEPAAYDYPIRLWYEIIYRLAYRYYHARRFLSRAWQRCPDCGKLELVAW